MLILVESFNLEEILFMSLEARDLESFTRNKTEEVVYSDVKDFI